MDKVIIFSAPSGSGKTTLVKYCLEKFSNLEFSISATTRQPRGTEQDGKDYHFLSLERFKQLISEEAFVEYEEVYTDKFYGTLKSEVERIWKSGNTVIFDVDVVGGVNLKNIFGEKALSIFIAPPSIKELKNRLISRGTDDEATIKIRVDKAAEELSYQDKFDKIIINDDLSVAQKEVEQVIHQFLKLMEENKKNTKTNLPVPDFLKYQEFQMPADDRLEEEILKLKREKQIPILAHNLYGAVFLKKVSDASGNLLEIAKKIEDGKWTKVLFSGTMFQAGVLKGLFPNIAFWIPKEVSKGTLEEDFYDTLREVYLSLKYEYPIVELEDDSLLVNYQK